MTIEEARRCFKLKHDDIVFEKGLVEVMRSNKELYHQTNSEAVKQECLREIEACETLMQIARKEDRQ